MKLQDGLFLILICLSFKAYNQIDAHYWTHQYGAKGLLLNGAVIASAEDETNIFYNPGALGTDDNLGFAISFLSPSYQQLTVSNFLGDDNKIVDRGLDLSPGFLAIRFQPFSDKRLTMGITTFQRYKTDINFQDRVTDRINQTGFFLIRADLDFTRKISEDWFGVGISYNLTDNIGFGFTQFSTWHSQGLDFKLKKEIFLADSPQELIASWRSEFDFDISYYSGFITKFGLAFSEENLSLGITYTSPTYGILSSGASYTIDDQRIVINDGVYTVLSNRKDTELLEFKTPFSIGLGIEYHFEDFCLSLSTEYFKAINNYTYFLDTDDSFNGLSPNTPETNVTVSGSRESVFNVAVGIQLNRKDDVTWLAGFRTDFNERSNLLLNQSADYLSSTPDIFHLSGGALFNFGKNEFSIGMDMAYGKSSRGNQITNLQNVNLDNLFSFSGESGVSSNYFSLSLFITYDFIYNSISNPDSAKDESDY